MFFRKRIEKPLGEDVEKRQKELSEELEKADIPAIIIAAFLTLWPAVAVIIAVLLFLYWLFVR